MPERIQQILNRILEWWNHFTSKQKTAIIAIAAGVVVAIAILVTVITRPKYEPLVSCDSTKEASEIRDLLDSEGLTYQVSEDGLTIQILKEELSDANLLLGANNIPTASYDLNNVTDGSFSTTESDKQKKYKLYLETRMEEDLANFAAVKSADVQLTIPKEDGTLLSKEEQSFCSVILELEGEVTPENAQAMAQFIKTALGNDNTDNITILDRDGNLLFSGDDNASVTGSASNQLSVKQQAENLVKNEVKKVLLGTNEFDNVEVASNLVLDFSKTDRTEHTYTPADGQSQGVLSHEDNYQADSTNSGAGVPGTDSNEQTYVFQDSANSSSSVTETSRDYLPNETITAQEIPPGLIKYGESSISVTCIKYDVIKEEDVKQQGLLDGISWEEYKLANGERTKATIDEDLVNVVAKATGLSAESIAMVAYTEPMFLDKEGLNVNPTDIIQIVLIIVILALLGFVVLRSMRSEQVEEEEEPLSVESLLQSTPNGELEDIGMEEMSETRRVIEKFVEDNPEAAANLLRNWLNEEWG